MNATYLPYASESPFWYFLARQAVLKSEHSLPTILASLNDRAGALKVPVRYTAPHALSWAVLCQLFQLVHPLASQIGRFAFTQMRLGFGHVLAPKGFVQLGFKRLLGNIQGPAFADRTPDQSVVDTFVANAGRLVDEDAIPATQDALIMQRLLTDDVVHDLGRRAVEPPPRLWAGTVDEYGQRRPGWLRRTFTSPDKWLFGDAT